MHERPLWDYYLSQSLYDHPVISMSEVSHLLDQYVRISVCHFDQTGCSTLWYIQWYKYHSLKTPLFK